MENPPLDEPSKPLDLIDIRNSLKSLMWRNVGVRRSAEPMAHARDTIARYCRYVLVRQFREPLGWELQNMLTVAHLMVRCAMAREESRGVHLAHRFPANGQPALVSPPARVPGQPANRPTLAALTCGRPVFSLPLVEADVPGN